MMWWRWLRKYWFKQSEKEWFRVYNWFMSIKAVIFDAGGVLHTSENDHMHEDIKRTLKIGAKQFSQHYYRLVELPVTGRTTEDEFWKRFRVATGSEEKLPRKSLFRREYEKRFQAHGNVLDLVEKLKKKGYKVAVLSDTIPTHYQVNQEKGLYASFSVKVFSFQVGVKKPAAKIYALTLEKLGIKSQEAVFVDDIKENVNGAKKVGIKGIQFKNHRQLIGHLGRLVVFTGGDDEN